MPLNYFYIFAAENQNNMNLKYILIVWGAMLFCVGCSEDDVDSSYSFDVAGLKATVTNDKGSVVEMNTILLDSLQQQGFVGEVSFSEETRGCYPISCCGICAR